MLGKAPQISILYSHLFLIIIVLIAIIITVLGIPSNSLATMLLVLLVNIFRGCWWESLDYLKRNRNWLSKIRMCVLHRCDWQEDWIFCHHIPIISVNCSLCPSTLNYHSTAGHMKPTLVHYLDFIIIKDCVDQTQSRIFPNPVATNGLDKSVADGC